MQPQGRQRRDPVQMLLGPGDGGIEGDYNRRRPQACVVEYQASKFGVCERSPGHFGFLVDWLVGFFL